MMKLIGEVCMFIITAVSGSGMNRLIVKRLFAIQNSKEKGTQIDKIM